MALVICKACEQPISKNARACPACGEPRPKRTSLFTWLVVASFAVMIYQCSSTPKRISEPSSTLMSADSAAAAERRQAEMFDAGARFDCQRAIKKFLKDPSSAKFDDFDEAPVLNTGKQVVVTMLVRSKNSFGAIVPQRFRCDQTVSGQDTTTFKVTGL